MALGAKSAAVMGYIHYTYTAYEEGSEQSGNSLVNGLNYVTPCAPVTSSNHYYA